MNYKGVLFDLDGTLVDSKPIYSRSLARLLEDRCGLHMAEGELHAVIAGRPTRETLRRFTPERVDELASEWLTYAGPAVPSKKKHFDNETEICTKQKTHHEEIENGGHGHFRLG